MLRKSVWRFALSAWTVVYFFVTRLFSRPSVKEVVYSATLLLILMLLWHEEHKTTSMKNLGFIVLMIALAMNLDAQTVHLKSPNVTTFLGIPIDGSKQAMISNLKAKGFTWNSTLECLEGEFNGKDVYIFVVTNNNKVCRLAIADKIPSSESQIRIRYNTLCNQFKTNGKYVPATDVPGDFELDDNEDISYNITVKNKEYQATFYQLSKKLDTTGRAKYIKERISSDKNWESRSNTYKNTTIELYEEQFLRNQMDTIIQDEDTPYRVVWFRIQKAKDYSSEYIIWMYYDNAKNHANGDDL